MEYRLLGPFRLLTPKGQERRASARERWEHALSLHHWTGFAYGRPFALWGLGHLALQDGDAAAAARLLSESLEVAVERHDPDAIAAALEGLAAVEVLSDEPERAAELLGAADRHRQAMGAPAPLINREQAATTREQVRELLGEARLAAGLEAGGALDTAALAAGLTGERRPDGP